MNKHFEDIVENWTNGNRSEVRMMVNKLKTINKHYEFMEWLRRRFTFEWVDKTELFNLVCFIAFT